MMNILSVLGKSFKSKTIGANVFGTIILNVLNHFGIQPDLQVTILIYAVGNIILRCITKDAITDK